MLSTDEHGEASGLKQPYYPEVFHEFGPFENNRLIENRLNDVIAIDVNREWELRVSNPNTHMEKATPSQSSLSLSSIKDYLTSIF